MLGMGCIHGAINHACMQGAGVFRQLRDRMGHVMTNNSAIATILAGPLVLQQKSNLYHNVLYSLLIVGLLASIPVVGGVGVAVPLVTLITEGMSAASLVTVACECTVGLCSAAGESVLWPLCHPSDCTCFMQLWFVVCSPQFWLLN